MGLDSISMRRKFGRVDEARYQQPKTFQSNFEHRQDTTKNTKNISSIPEEILGAIPLLTRFRGKLLEHSA
jgi:hypothetical protein